MKNIKSIGRRSGILLIPAILCISAFILIRFSGNKSIPLLYAAGLIAVLRLFPVWINPPEKRYFVDQIYWYPILMFTDAITGFTAGITGSLLASFTNRIFRKSNSGKPGADTILMIIPLGFGVMAKLAYPTMLSVQTELSSLMGKLPFIITLYTLFQIGELLARIIRPGRVDSWKNTLRWSIRTASINLLFLPVAMLTIYGMLNGGSAGLILIPLPVLLFAVLGYRDARNRYIFSLKEYELSTHNRLTEKLVASAEHTEFVTHLRDFFFPEGKKGLLILLTRQEDSGGWIGWTDREQLTLSESVLPDPPEWNCRTETGSCETAGLSRGNAFGLSSNADTVLLIEGDVPLSLRKHFMDVRENLLSLIYRAWLALGLTLRSQESFLAGALLLTRLADSKDNYTHGHSLRVASLSTAIGIELGLSEEKLRNLQVGALLHDIGKIAIPDEILVKRSMLNLRERKVIEKHPVEGAGIVSGMKGYEEVGRIIKSHHERLDGSGYPDGSSMKEIPFLARIVAVADTFDAITSTRTYRISDDHYTAFQAISVGKGIQFDSRVVNALENVIRNKKQVKEIENTEHKG